MGMRRSKTTPDGRFILYRFNGDEVYRLESAVMFGITEATGVTLWFEARADRNGAHWCEDTAYIGTSHLTFDALKIYDMGDTGLFSDMKFIGEYYKPDLVLIPIGGQATMDPRDAAFATARWT